jgi:hypothetical protein
VPREHPDEHRVVRGARRGAHPQHPCEPAGRRDPDALDPEGSLARTPVGTDEADGCVDGRRVAAAPPDHPFDSVTLTPDAVECPAAVAPADEEADVGPPPTAHVAPPDAPPAGLRVDDPYPRRGHGDVVDSPGNPGAGGRGGRPPGRRAPVPARPPRAARRPPRSTRPGWTVPRARGPSPARPRRPNRARRRRASAASRRAWTSAADRPGVPRSTGPARSSPPAGPSRAVMPDA